MQQQEESFVLQKKKCQPSDWELAWPVNHFFFCSSGPSFAGPQFARQRKRGRQKLP
jgi:hypothetical protein